MQILQALFLGLIQGLTEFIPVSSSGHLLLAEKLLHLQVGGLLFDVMLHVGTLAALVAYFRKDLWQIVRSLFTKPKQDRLWWYLIVGTVPAVIGGYLLQPLAEGSLRATWLVAVNLIWVGLLMLSSDRITGKKQLTDLKTSNSLLVGLAQVLALIPGVSRSGITIVAGVFQKLTRESAAHFSFLLAIPVTFGAILKLVLDHGVVEITTNISTFVAGLVMAAVSGYLAIAWLLKYLSNHRLAPFAYYRMGLALIVLLVTLLK